MPAHIANTMLLVLHTTHTVKILPLDLLHLLRLSSSYALLLVPVLALGHSNIRVECFFFF